MKSPQIPRVVLGADVLLFSLVQPAGSSAQLLNTILNGKVVPVLDSRLSALYQVTLKCDEVSLPQHLCRDMLLKLSRLSDMVSPSPLPYISQDLPVEDVLYMQIAFSAGIIPVVKTSLHYYLDSSLAKSIPLFTPEGFMKELTVFQAI